MFNPYLFALACCFSLTLSAQQTQTSRFAAEFTIGINATDQANDADEAGSGLYLDVSAQRIFPLGQRLSFSGGLGLYTTIFNYTDRNRFRFGCDAPVEFGGQGQRTFTEFNTFHAGLQLPARLQLALGRQNRFNVFAGASLMVPVLGFIRTQIVECGLDPIGEHTLSGSRNFRGLIPEFTLGFGYGVRLPKNQGMMYVGPFFSATAASHTVGDELDYHPDLRTYTIGIKASGRQF